MSLVIFAVIVVVAAIDPVLGVIAVFVLGLILAWRAENNDLSKKRFRRKKERDGWKW